MAQVYPCEQCGKIIKTEGLCECWNPAKSPRHQASSC